MSAIFPGNHGPFRGSRARGFLDLHGLLDRARIGACTRCLSHPGRPRPLLVLACWASALAAACSLPAGRGPAPGLSPIQVQVGGSPIAAHDFHTGLVDLPGPVLSVTIANLGSTTVDLGDIRSVKVGGSNKDDFSVSHLASSVLPGGACTTFDLAFNPHSPASSSPRTAFVTIDPVSGGTSASFAVSGTAVDFGVVRGGTMIASYDFGTVVTGAGAEASFTILNQGASAIDVQPLQLSDTTSFHLSAAPASPIAAGQSATFTLGFTPGDFVVSHECTVSIPTAGGHAPLQLAVSGMGTSGLLQVIGPDNQTEIHSGDQLDLGKVSTKGTAARTIHVWNRSQGTDNLSWTCHVSSSSPPDYLYGIQNAVATPGHAIPLSLQEVGTAGLSVGTNRWTLTLATSDAGQPAFTIYVTADFGP
ncbi:MAG TPA: choice-of-anchor D domain-containing protein [Spirochaetia bacterium]|nr:choice-of-anchor D domain-containing protein [Spirochaetia bacterium]